MIFDLPFDVLFSHGYEEPLIVNGWEKNQIRNYVYYDTHAEGLRFQIILRGNNYYLKVNNDGKSPVTGFVGVRYPWKKRTEDYTMIPAVYYDGNYFPDQKKFPILHLPENPVFQASFSASSFPSVLVKEGNKGYYYEISHKSYAGWNGIELDAEKNSLTIYAPAKEKNLYGHSKFHESRQPYTWQPGDVISVRFSRNEFCCERISDIFDYHWEKVIRSDLYPAYYPKYSDPASRIYPEEMPKYGLSSESYFEHGYVDAPDHSFRAEPSVKLLKLAFGMNHF